jgi:hypothetical protein
MNTSREIDGPNRRRNALESMLSFLQEQWPYAVAALVAIVLIVRFVKSVIRWLMIVAIGASLVVFFLNDDGGTLTDVGKQLAEKAVNYTKETAVDGLLSEVKEAQYTQQADGTFEVATPNFKLRGSLGTSDAMLVVKGQEFPLQLSGPLKQFIEQAKENTP